MWIAELQDGYGEWNIVKFDKDLKEVKDWCDAYNGIIHSVRIREITEGGVTTDVYNREDKNIPWSKGNINFFYVQDIILPQDIVDTSVFNKPNN